MLLLLNEEHLLHNKNKTLPLIKPYHNKLVFDEFSALSVVPEQVIKMQNKQKQGSEITGGQKKKCWKHIFLSFSVLGP